MSEAPDKSHTLFINLFILVLPLSSAKENFLEGKSVLFLLALLYFLPSARRCLCLCLPVFHKLSLEMSDSCLHQNLYPMTVLLNKKQACCENTWCTATLSASTLSKSIKDSVIHWFLRRSMCTIMNERQHAGTYMLQCGFSVLEIRSKSFSLRHFIIFFRKMPFDTHGFTPVTWNVLYQ